MISFENTKIAFDYKSDRELRKAYWLFKLVGSPALVKFGKWATQFALRLRLPIKGLIKSTIFKQFCGGETIAECKQTTATLAAYGVGTILDYSVEGQTSEKNFETTTKEIIETIHDAKNKAEIPLAVFKVSGVSRFDILEKFNDENAENSDAEWRSFQGIKDRVLRICQAAFDADVPVMIDAEESWIQDTIDRLAYNMMAQFNSKKPIVYNTLQMYRHDRLAHFQAQLEIAKSKGYLYAAKLVRGAYMEKERQRAKEKGYPSPINATKSESDALFDTALEFAVNEIQYCAIVAGSHNEESAMHLVHLMEEKNIDKSHPHVYFAQLLGMSDHISFNLSSAGYNVAKYVPYGPIKEVLPYLIRRAEENTSAAGQMSREMRLIQTEKMRRKQRKK
jgi:proline dehydrogenase